VTASVSVDSTQAVTRVPVALAERSYDILIGAGLLANAGATLAARFPGRAVAIVTDETVGAVHGAALEQSLAAAGLRHVRIAVPAGEASKRFAMLEQVVDSLLAHRLERGDLVLALGGGVVGDLAGFAAAIVRRGMGFVQMPTSLLAQVDSSVGGKTGINSRHGKNLIGAFYQPALVLADTDVLDTLSTREFRAGYAEVAKYGLIDDPGFFSWLEANWRGVFQGGRDRVHAIAVACRAKAAVVARDETEMGDRALLNLGHTFGHALEAATGYDGSRLVHGEGVAIGMAQAFRFSARLGLCPADDAARMAAHLKTVGLPTELADIPGGVGDADNLMTAIGQDKKVSRGKLTFILARGIGQSFIAKDVDPAAVREFLSDELARRRES
jgi:3-dehydroquinate synthase